MRPLSISAIPEKLRAQVEPRRAVLGSAAAPTEKSAKRELDRIAKAYEKKRPGGDSSPKEIFERGLAITKEPGLRKLRKAAHELLSAPSLAAVKAAPIDVLAVAERMAHNAVHDAAIAMPVGLTRGARDAVQVMAASLDLDLEAKGGFTTCVYVVSNEKDEPSRWEADWAPLRHIVCAAPEAEYQRALNVGASLRKKLPLLKRGRIAYAFPDEPWGADDLRAFMKDDELREHHGGLSFLLGAVNDLALVKAYLALPHQYEQITSYALSFACVFPEKDLLAMLAEALPRLLTKPKYGPLLKGPPRALVEAISIYRTKDAAALLAPYLGHPIVGPLVAAYFQDAPELRGALDAVAKGKSKMAEAAKQVLASGSTKNDSAPLAKDVDVPSILRERPWLPRKDAPVPVILALSIPENAEERIELSEAERELRFEKENVVRDMTRAELAAWRAEVEKGEYATADWVCHYVKPSGVEYVRVPPDEGLRAWNDGHVYLDGTYVEFLARHGRAAIPGFVKRDWLRWLAYQEVDDEPIMEVLARLITPRIAPVMARIVARRKNFRKPALAWMLRHSETAALGLVSSALGPPGDARDDAELSLQLMTRVSTAHDAREAITRAARSYGAPAEAAIASLLAQDPLAIDANPPKAPAFLRRGDLPPVHLKGGARLPNDAMDALLEMLRVAPLEPPYPGVLAVMEACDGASLGALSRGLLEQWVLAGSPGRFEWMLFSVALLPSEEGTRRVAQLARDWARRDRKKALRASAVLAALATDLSLLHLGHIAATSRFDELRAAAQAMLDEAAASRGLTRDELEDRTVPDLDLDASGTLELSLDARKLVVSLDEGLRPFVRGEKTFPRAGKDDDAALVKGARLRFDALKVDAAAIADGQIRRFEQAMVRGRTWSASDFAQRVVGHPLLVHLARRLIWEAGGVMFRVAEDGSLAGASDASVTLGAERVRVAHPARMNEESRRAWATLFADYRIAQPFEQIGRVVTAPPRDGQDTRIACAPIEVAATKVLGILESRGWRRNDRGHVTAYVRAVTGGEAYLPLDPGISMDDIKQASPQKIHGVELPLPCSKLDPVDYAEIVRDLEALR